MTVTLMALAFACAAGLFGVAGILFFWLTAAAVVFLLVMLIVVLEVILAKIADACDVVSAIAQEVRRIDALSGLREVS